MWTIRSQRFRASHGDAVALQFQACWTLVLVGYRFESALSKSNNFLFCLYCLSWIYKLFWNMCFPVQKVPPQYIYFVPNCKYCTLNNQNLWIYIYILYTFVSKNECWRAHSCIPVVIISIYLSLMIKKKLRYEDIFTSEDSD